jgi:hypothetical protein
VAFFVNLAARRPLVVTALPLSAAFGLLSAADVLAFSPAPVSSALKAFAIASLVGAAVGGLLALLFRCLSLLPNIVWRSFWCLVGSPKESRCRFAFWSFKLYCRERSHSCHDHSCTRMLQLNCTVALRLAVDRPFGTYGAPCARN